MAIFIEASGSTFPDSRVAHGFEFLAKRFPIGLIGGALALFLGVQTFRDGLRVTVTSGHQKRPSVYSCLKIDILLSQFDEQIGRAEFVQPKPDFFWRWRMAKLKIVVVKEAPNHWPIFVSLGFLGMNQIGQSEDFAGGVRELNGRAAGPKNGE